jgi:hypothetical protein
MKSAWLSLVCVFFGGGFFFLGVFGRRFGKRETSGAQVSLAQYVMEHLTPTAVNMLVMMTFTVSVVILFDIGRAGYAIIEREMDIQAAKVGISTPTTTTPTPSPRKRQRPDLSPALISSDRLTGADSRNSHSRLYPH